MRSSLRLPGRLRWLLFVPLLLAGDRPDLYLIPLKGTGPSSRLTGTAKLTPARSPFGVATTKDGQFVFAVEVVVPQLPPADAYGAGRTGYVAWVASAKLDRIERIGPLVPGTPLKGKVALPKFMIVITAETGNPTERWAGPIVMRGNSPSSYLTNFSGHTMFNGGVPQ